MLADDVGVVGDLEPRAVAFPDVDVEVIAPEFDHHFHQLPAREDRLQDRAAHELAEQHAGLVFVQLARGLLKHREAALNMLRLRVLDAMGVQLRLDPHGRPEAQ